MKCLPGLNTIVWIVIVLLVFTCMKQTWKYIMEKVMHIAPILSWKMALLTSYNHQKELNLGASESMRFVDQLNFSSQRMTHRQSLDQHHS